MGMTVEVTNVATGVTTTGQLLTDELLEESMVKEVWELFDKELGEDLFSQARHMAQMFGRNRASRYRLSEFGTAEQRTEELRNSIRWFVNRGLNAFELFNARECALLRLEGMAAAVLF